MAEFGADVAAAGEEGHVEEPSGGEEEVGGCGCGGGYVRCESCKLRWQGVVLVFLTWVFVPPQT